MRLWTWHLPDWDITCQRRDLSRMAEASGEDIARILRPLYERLHREVKTEGFIFCCMRYEHWRQLEVRRLWVLDVPTHQVFKYMDSCAWEAIRKTAKRSKEEALEARAWDSLFLSEEEALSRLSSGRAASVVALLRVPIATGWVIDKTRFNMGTRAPASKTGYEDLPTSESEARWCRQ